MNEPLDLTKPIYMRNGTPVPDLFDSRDESQWPLKSPSIGVIWSADGFFRADRKIDSMDLTNTPPVESAAAEPEPIPDLIADELAALRQENEHLKREVMRMHAEYRTLWNMTNKIEGRRATSR